MLSALERYEKKRQTTKLATPRSTSEEDASVDDEGESSLTEESDYYST